MLSLSFVTTLHTADADAAAADTDGDDDSDDDHGDDTAPSSFHRHFRQTHPGSAREHLFRCPERKDSGFDVPANFQSSVFASASNKC